MNQTNKTSNLLGPLVDVKKPGASQVKDKAEEISDPANILYGMIDVPEECLSASECESQSALLEALTNKPIY